MSSLFSASDKPLPTVLITIVVLVASAAVLNVVHRLNL